MFPCPSDPLDARSLVTSKPSSQPPHWRTGPTPRNPKNGKRTARTNNTRPPIPFLRQTTQSPPSKSSSTATVPRPFLYFNLLIHILFTFSRTYLFTSVLRILAPYSPRIHIQMQPHISIPSPSSKQEIRTFGSDRISASLTLPRGSTESGHSPDDVDRVLRKEGQSVSTGPFRRYTGNETKNLFH